MTPPPSPSLLLILFLTLSHPRPSAANFTCYFCSDCRSAGSTLERRPCPVGADPNHRPHCVTAVLDNGTTMRQCGTDNASVPVGCSNRKNVATGATDYVCRCDYSDCNGYKDRSKVQGRKNVLDVQNDDKQGQAFFTKHGGWLIGGLVIFFVLLALVIASMKLGCKYCPCHTWFDKCPKWKRTLARRKRGRGTSDSDSEEASHADKPDAGVAKGSKVEPPGGSAKK